MLLRYALDRRDLSKGDEQGKVLHTGDCGYFDDENFFYINDRKDRQVKLFGNRIDLEAIEEEIVRRYGDECRCEMSQGMVYIYHSIRNVETEVCDLVSKLLNIPYKNIKFILCSE